MFLMLFILDLVVIMSALSISYLFGIETAHIGSIQVLWSGKSFYFISFVYVVFRYIFGFYERRYQNKVDILFKIGIVFVLTSIAIVFANYIFGAERVGIYGRQVLFGGLVAASAIQVIISIAIQKLLESKLSKRNYLFITSNETKEWLSTDLIRNRFLAKVDWLIYEDNMPESMGEFLKELNLKIQQYNYEAIVVSFSFKKFADRIIDNLIHLRFQGVDIFEMSTFYEKEFRQIPVSNLCSQILLLKDGFDIIKDPIGLRLKRLLDILLALVLLTLTWPLMILTMLAIWLESGGPILYSQNRTGLAGKIFKIYKFRSMVNDAEKEGAQWAQVKDARVTKVGQFIRLVRLDELPQIFNILKGNMSFIGPRPERPEFNEMLAQKIPFYELRHSMLPGLTGWAQVIYRYGGSIEDAKQKLQYDLYYIKNQSFFLDLRIILKTVQVVLFGKGR